MIVKTMDDAQTERAEAGGKVSSTDRRVTLKEIKTGEVEGSRGSKCC